MKSEIASRRKLICFNYVSADQEHTGPTHNSILHHGLLNNGSCSL